MNNKALLQKALDALEQCRHELFAVPADVNVSALHDAEKSIDALRAALAHQEAAPVAPTAEPVMIYHGKCIIDCGEHGHQHVEMLKMIPEGSKLYTHPAPVALSDLSEAIVRDVCELEVSKPFGFDDDDLIVKVGDLKMICERAIEAAMRGKP